MTKRSALLTSGGLLMALMAGIVALWLGRGVVGAQANPTARMVPKPIVKTVTQVVTVHKQRPAPPGSGGGQTITIVRHLPPTSTGSGSGGSYQDDSTEQEVADPVAGGGGDD